MGQGVIRFVIGVICSVSFCQNSWHDMPGSMLGVVKVQYWTVPQLGKLISELLLLITMSLRSIRLI